MKAQQTPRLSSGVVVVRRVEGDFLWRFLMLRAYRNWDFPKGLVEEGEDPLAAARREVIEETLVDDLRFPWGEAFMETGPYSRNKVARYYLAETDAQLITLPVSPELGRPEHHEYRWLTPDEAFELASPRIQPVVRWASSVVAGASVLAES